MSIPATPQQTVSVNLTTATVGTNNFATAAVTIVSAPAGSVLFFNWGVQDVTQTATPRNSPTQQWTRLWRTISGAVLHETWMCKVVGAGGSGTSVIIDSVVAHTLSAIKGQISEWRSCYVVAYLATAASGNSATITTPSVTPTSSKNALALIFCRGNDALVSGPTGGFTDPNVSGSGNSRYAYKVIANTVGAAEQGVWTFTSANWCAGIVILYSLPDSAAQLAVTTQPVNTQTGVAMANVVVKKVGQDGATVDATFQGAVTMYLSDGTGWLDGGLLKTVTVNAVNGVATFNPKIFGGGSHTLSFSASGCVGVDSAAFSMTAGTAGAYVALPITVNSVLYTDARVWIPGEYAANNTKKWPVVVAIHGSAEQGNDGTTPQTAMGLAVPINANTTTWSVITVLPRLPAAGPPRTDYYDIVLGVLDQVLAAYSCDTNHIALTGLSFGGTLGFEILLYTKFTKARTLWSAYCSTPGTVPVANQNAIRAFTPLTSQGGADAMARDFSTLPYYAIQSDADASMPPTTTIFIYTAWVTDFPSSVFVWNQYLTEDHPGTWTRTYTESTVIRWLLDQILAAAGDQFWGVRKRRRRA